MFRPLLFAAMSTVVPHLDKSLFTRKIELMALRVEAKKCGIMRERLSKFLFNMPRHRNIVTDASSPSPGTTKLVLLSQDITGEKLEGLDPELRDFAFSEGATAVPHTLSLGYESFTADQVLRRVLPEGMDVPSSYEQVGHIMHVNLREEQLPYKHLIASVLLDKVPRMRTVVNKVDSISNQFRVFPMEVLAGDDDMVAEVRENNCVFKLDYGKVYWNSRLEQEHRRIIGLMEEGDVLVDMMAGIGPFAVPAAKKGVTVFANDLNPSSYQWLCENVKRNRVKVACSCLDARAFARAIVSASPPPELAGFPRALEAAHARGRSVHVAMNLPASALEFLDVFPGLFDRARWKGPLPTVHVHCFSKELGEKAMVDVCRRAGEVLGCDLEGRSTTHIVRDVAPSKLMLCVSFDVPEDVGFGSVQVQAPASGEEDRAVQRAAGGAGGGGDSTSKRQRTTANGGVVETKPQS